MKIYINGQDVTDYVCIGTEENKQKDETLGGGSFVVAPITKEEPFAPGSIIFYGDSDYVLVCDNVSLIGRNPTAYKHEVQFAELSHALEMFSIRGQNFMQPMENPHNVGITTFAKINYSDFYPTPVTINDDIHKKANAPTDAKVVGCDILLTVHTYSTFYEEPGKNPTTATDITDYDWTGTVMVYGKKGGINRVIASLSRSDFTKCGAHKYKAHVDVNLTGYYDMYAICTDATPGTTYGGISVNAKLSLDSYFFNYGDIFSDLISACGPKSDAGVFIAVKENSYMSQLSAKKAIDFSFQQGTSLYDAFRDIADANECKLKAEYNRTNGKILVYFERYGNVTGGVIENVVGQSASKNDAERNQSLEVDFQNSTTHTYVNCPSSNSFAKVQSTKLGTPDRDSCYFITNEPIFQIKEMSLLFPDSTDGYQANSGTYNFSVRVKGSFVLDVTEYVYEREEQALLPVDSWATNTDPTQANTITYTKGSPNVHTGTIQKTPTGDFYKYDLMLTGAIARMLGRFGPMPTTYEDAFRGPMDLKFNLRYLPLYAGSARIENPFEKKYGLMFTENVIRQSGSMNDLQKLGRCIHGIALRAGETSITKAVAFDDPSELPNVGDISEEADGQYVVTMVRMNHYKTGSICYVSLEKNFNRISNRTRIDREIRQTEISPSLSLVSELVYQDYLYVLGWFDAIPTFTQGALVGILDSVKGVFDGSQQPKEPLMWLGSYKKADSYSENVPDYAVFVPVTEYNVGSSYCLEGGFTHAKMAGYKTVETNTGWWVFESVTYSSAPIYYASDNGAFEKLRFGFTTTQPNLDDYSAPKSAYVADDGVTPLLEVKKHQNEVFRLNYEVSMKSYGDMVVYPYFMEWIGAQKSKFYGDRVATTRMRLYFRDSSEPDFMPGVSSIENSSGGNLLSVNDMTIVKNNEDHYLAVMLRSAVSAQGQDKWALTDEDGRPLIACNYQTPNRPIGVKFLLSANRLNVNVETIVKVELGNHVKSATIGSITVTESGYVNIKGSSSVLCTAVCDEGYHRDPTTFTPPTTGTRFSTIAFYAVENQ